MLLFSAGQQIGGYTLIEKLGSGGFGAVWLAEKRSAFVTKKVAVKLPHEEQVNFDAIRQEATLWEQASGHPNVLPIIDADIYDGQVVIVSEFADGGSLGDRLKREDKLTIKEAIEMTIGILNGLGFLHGKEIIHRDIKPQNILLQGNTPRLADFGISRAMQTTAISSTIIGTDAYMSPESFDGKRSIQTDIWSVGVVLYQMLKGSLPFPQEHPSERMFAVLTKEFEPMDESVPFDLKRIVEKALAKLPENRYQTTTEMRDELQKSLVGIAHPTLAKTEMLKVENLPSIASENIETKTVVPSEVPRTQAIETETVVNPKPVLPIEIFSPGESVATQVAGIAPLAAMADKQADPTHATAVGSRSGRQILILVVGTIVLFSIALFLASRFSGALLPSPVKKLLTKFYPATNSSDDPSRYYSPLTSFQSESKKYGFKDKDGDKVVVEPKYDSVGIFSEGMCSVASNNTYGYIDTTGREVIPLKYDSASVFGDGLAPVKFLGAFGYIDKKGIFMIDGPFEDASPFYEHLAAVKLHGKWGYIDTTGKIAIEPRFTQANPFFNGVAPASITESAPYKFALIDRSGIEKTPYKYDYISSIWGNHETSVELNDKWGIIDDSGREIISPAYDIPFSFFNDKAKVNLNGREFYIDKNGAETTPPAKP